MDYVPSQDVADGENADDQGAVEAAHSRDEEDGAVNGVHLWVLEGLDVRGAGPADLLQEPAEEGGGGVGGGKGLRVEGDFPAVEEEVRRKVAVLVDNSLNANGGLGVPVEEDGFERVESKRSAGSWLAVYSINSTCLATRDGQLGPIGGRSEGSNKTFMAVVDGECRAAPSDERICAHAPNRLVQGVRIDPGIRITRPQELDIICMPEDNAEDHVGEHDVFLALVRLVEANGLKFIRDGIIEDAMLAEDVCRLFRYHFECIFPRLFQEVLWYRVRFVSIEFSVYI